jgi:hypothetical protein
MNINKETNFSQLKDKLLNDWSNWNTEVYKLDYNFYYKNYEFDIRIYRDTSSPTDKNPKIMLFDMLNLTTGFHFRSQCQWLKKLLLSLGFNHSDGYYSRNDEKLADLIVKLLSAIIKRLELSAFE